METKWLARIVGLVIAVASFAAAGLLFLAIGMDINFDLPDQVESVLFGTWDILYDPEVPPTRVFIAAGSVAVLAIALVAFVEWYTLRTSRRSTNRREYPLSPTASLPSRSLRIDPVTVTVLIPAHNEALSLPVTLPALMSQSFPPNRMIVVADNCTDGTEEVAASLGAEVMKSVDNSFKKAGALNQALAFLLPTLGENDLVMVMDADTALDPGFIASAVERFEADWALSAVGGIFYGEDGHGLLGQFQRSEYVRYSRTINRRAGKVFVLTGTSSLFRPAALRAVAAARGDTIPGNPGDVYDTAALTEDNELTIALKSLGALMVSPAGCTVVTELMPSWKDLWRQRMRWQRGALENVGAYGITPATWRYWGQQVGIGYGVIALYSYMLLMLITVLAVDTWIWFPFWLGIGLIFVAERVITVWKGGVRARWLAAALFPELCFDMFLNTVFIRSIWDITAARTARWGHVSRAGIEETD